MNFKKYGLPIIYFGLGILLTILVIGKQDKPAQEHSEHQTVTEWTCSMHPQIRQPNPGDCPICGMDLIPATGGTGNLSPTSFKLSEQAIALAGVQTSPITHGSTDKLIHLQGEIVPNEELINVQASYFAGRIDGLAANFEGTEVTQGQILARIYSPQLILAQQELLSAYEGRKSNPSLYQSARKKLILLKLDDEQIETVLNARTPFETFEIKANFSGFVTKKYIEQGDYVKVGQPLFDITDLSNLWVVFNAYEPDLPFIRPNQTLTFSVPALPGKEFKSLINWIDPRIDPMRHTISVRAEVVNRTGLLKPNMLTEGIVKGSVPGMKDTLLIPKSAVLWTGNTSVAYVKTMQDGEPVFQIREITLGEALDNFYILKKGISEGEEVVSAGTFSVDAAAQLLNKQSMMNPAHKEISNNLSSKLSESNRKGLELFIKGYFRLNDDLIQSRHADAAKSASEMLKQLEQLTESGFMVDALSYWQNKKSDLVKNLKMIAGSDDLKMQRKMYKPLSKTIIEIVKSFRIYNKPVYIQFCPMADNNIGATWISETKEILNPYFGNEMLNCGETKEIIGDAK